jgi:hypothetical protein
MFKRIVVALLALLMLSACTPSKQYDGSKSEGAFFAVPNGWSKISQSKLESEEGKDATDAALERLSLVTFQVGYTKLAKIEAREVFMLKPTEEPVMYVRFRELLPEERNAISLNTLRNLIFPITDVLDGTISDDRNFEIYDDQEVVEKGARGVNLLYSFDYEEVNTTVNQIALYSNDQSKIYLFVIRCSTECYNKSLDEIDEIVKSITVRGA